jgi:hypothetical protein
MNFVDYISNAVRTESMNMDLIRGSSDSSRLGNDNAIRLLHAALGLTTEVVELFEALEKEDGKNVKEEIGDMFWYLAIAFDSARNEFGDVIVMPGVDVSWIGMDLKTTKCALLSEVGKFADVIKRTIFYDAYCLESTTLRKRLVKIYSLLVWLVGVTGSGKAELIMEDNITKLKKRYGARFTEEGALHRDVEAELEHIE